MYTEKNFISFFSSDQVESQNYNVGGEEVRIIAFVNGNHFEVRDIVLNIYCYIWRETWTVQRSIGEYS